MSAVESPARCPSRPSAVDAPHPRIIVTIDGPAGTGKSSVAREVARRLGLDFLDTGAMYRAATAIAIDGGISPDDAPGVIRAVTGADLRFDWAADPPTILASGRPLSRRIRDADVTAMVSRVSAIGGLRAHMVEKQRRIAAEHPRLVTEGRDQGSVVFGAADVKIYLDAAADVRAQRRSRQQGEAAAGDEGRALREILERDRLDSTRADGPLVCPSDAVVVDTSAMDFEQVVSTLVDLIRARAGALLPRR